MSGSKLEIESVETTSDLQQQLGLCVRPYYTYRCNFNDSEFSETLYSYCIAECLRLLDIAAMGNAAIQNQTTEKFSIEEQFYRLLSTLGMSLILSS
jgi:hypothetical protein